MSESGPIETDAPDGVHLDDPAVTDHLLDHVSIQQ